MHQHEWVDDQPNVAAEVEPDAMLIIGETTRARVRYDAGGQCWYLEVADPAGIQNLSGYVFTSRDDAIAAYENLPSQ